MPKTFWFVLKGKAKIITGHFPPGAIGRIVQMHGSYYAHEWNMGTVFESKVAQGLGEFASRYNSDEDLVIIAMLDEEIVGSLILDVNDPESDSRGAHLRFFILDDIARGTGLGNQMLNISLDHVDTHCDGKCWLTTFGGLEAAKHIYEKHNFKITKDILGTRWGFELRDQTFERDGKSTR